MQSRWFVSQVGARQNFSIPRGFHRKGALGVLYTDAWCRFGQNLLRRGPSVARSFAARSHAEIPSSNVKSFSLRSVLNHQLARKKSGTMHGRAAEYLRIGEWFARAVAADLATRDLNPATDAFLGFNTACLETLQMLRGRGIPTVCDQIDPAIVEEDLIHEESQKWPGWQPPQFAGRMPAAYWDRMAREWDAADLVLVNSAWTRDALIRQGVARTKLIVAPINCEPPAGFVPPVRRFDGPLTVLWIGTVSLRKGIQYLVEAARQLVGQPNIRFVVAGALEISDTAVASAPSNMTFLGRINRDQTARLFEAAHLFVLPTLSDGFAITQLEAMNQALPVITTARCGQVVTEGVDGNIVPHGDASALAHAIAALEADRAALSAMSRMAVVKARQFRLPDQADRIDAAIEAFRPSTFPAEPRCEAVPAPRTWKSRVLRSVIAVS